MYTEDELNDFGLRKTKFSQRIYENDLRVKLERNLQSMEKLTESPTDVPDLVKDFKHIELMPPKPKEKSFTRQKEPSFTSHKEKKEMRSNSTERKNEIQKNGKKMTPQAKKNESKISTWNGRSKSSRPSFTAETYTPPSFTRNSMGNTNKRVIQQIVF